MARRITGLLGLLVAAATMAAPVRAQDVTADMRDLLTAEVLQGCETELVNYCADVTPGEGRLLACLFARDDKLSGRCEFALYHAAVRLERVLDTIVYVMTQCEAEIQSRCADVQAGEGRIAQCLIARKSELDAACSQALSDAGVE